ncbi:MAG: lectin-like protein [Lachnospiraceae bacterium]|nr:lectin-like protein [Lachnospiraceae bacterium]MDD3616640.1 lectin-like protein [Lachnospiraceae bacterium]
MFCENCGEWLKEGTTTCPKCGTKSSYGSTSDGDTIPVYEYHTKKDIHTRYDDSYSAKKKLSKLYALAGMVVTLLILAIGFTGYYFIKNGGLSSKSGVIDPDDDSKGTYNGHTYERVDRGNYTWSEAYDLCIKNGGHIVTIESQEEMDFIIKLTHSGSDQKVFYWLGGLCDSTEDPYDFRWITHEVFDYTNWAPDQPQPSDTYADGDAVFMAMSHDGYYGEEGTWMTFANDPTTTRGFVCEWDFVDKNK